MIDRRRGLCATALAVIMLFAAACTRGGSDPAGFDGPDTALYDPTADVYLVSNVHGGALDKDNNGYIARVMPDGAMQRYWIQGGRDGVTLHAPRGMALVGDVLWVADIDVLRTFDHGSGRSLGEVAIAGASLLNGLSAGPDGSIYCTDSGLDASFAPTGTDAIWRIDAEGKLSTLARGVELGQPTGLVARASAVYVVSWRDGTFQEIDYRGNRTLLGKAPAAQLQGLVRVELPDAGAAGPAGGAAATQPVWFASSWAGNCVYRFDLAGGCVALPLRLERPAGLGCDTGRRRLLVPLPSADRLELLPL